MRFYGSSQMQQHLLHTLAHARTFRSWIKQDQRFTLVHEEAQHFGMVLFRLRAKEAAAHEPATCVESDESHACCASCCRVDHLSSECAALNARNDQLVQAINTEGQVFLIHT